MENQEANPQKVFPQSARTKCVKPGTSRVKDFDEGTAKWNELFIFEFPRKVCMSNLPQLTSTIGRSEAKSPT